jgi:hypothetical protein
MRLCEKFQMENIAKNTELHPRKVRKILDTTAPFFGDFAVKPANCKEY